MHPLSLFETSTAISGSQPAFSGRLCSSLKRCVSRISHSLDATSSAVGLAVQISCSWGDQRRQSKTGPNPHVFMLLFLPAETMRISQGEECGHKSTDSPVAAIGCGKVHLEGAGLEIGIPRSSLFTPTTLARGLQMPHAYQYKSLSGHLFVLISPLLHGTNRACSIWRLKSNRKHPRRSHSLRRLYLHSAEALPRRSRCWSMIKYSPYFSFNGSSGGYTGVFDITSKATD